MSRSTTLANSHHPDGAATAWSSEVHGVSVVLFGSAMARVADTIIDDLTALPTEYPDAGDRPHPPAVIAVARVFELIHRQLWSRNEAVDTAEGLGIGASVVCGDEMFFLQVGSSRLVHVGAGGEARDVAGQGDERVMLGLAAKSGIRVHRVALTDGCRLVAFAGDSAASLESSAVGATVSGLSASEAAATVATLVGPKSGAAAATVVDYVVAVETDADHESGSLGMPAGLSLSSTPDTPGAPPAETPDIPEPVASGTDGFDFQSDVVKELSDFMTELQRDPKKAAAEAAAPLPAKPSGTPPPTPVQSDSELGRNKSGLFEMDPDEAPSHRRAPSRLGMSDSSPNPHGKSPIRVPEEATLSAIDRTFAEPSPILSDEPSGEPMPTAEPESHDAAVEAALARAEETTPDGSPWVKWALVALVAITIPVLIFVLRPEMWDRIAGRPDIDETALTSPAVPGDPAVIDTVSLPSDDASAAAGHESATVDDDAETAPAVPAAADKPTDSGTPKAAAPTKAPDPTHPVDDQSVLIDILGPAGGKIRIDGKLLTAVTPATGVSVARGARLIEVDHGRLGRWSNLLDVGTGLDGIETAPTGVVSFAQTTAPGVVRLDGKVLSEPLPPKLDLPTGTHELTLSADGETIVTRTIFVAYDTPTLIDLPSAPRGDALIVAESRRFEGDGFGESEGDSVWVDRRFVGLTPVEVTVDAGTHSVRVSDGHRERVTRVLELEPSTIRVARADFGVTRRVILDPRKPENVKPGDPALLAVGVNDAASPPVESMTCEYRTSPEAAFRSSSMNRLEDGGAVWVSLVAGPETAGGYLEYYMSALDADGVQVVSEIHQVSFAGDTASM